MLMNIPKQAPTLKRLESVKILKSKEIIKDIDNAYSSISIVLATISCINLQPTLGLTKTPPVQNSTNPDKIRQEDYQELQLWLSGQGELRSDNVVFQAAQSYAEQAFKNFTLNEFCFDGNLGKRVKDYNGVIDGFVDNLSNSPSGSVGSLIWSNFPHNDPNQPRSNILLQAKSSAQLQAEQTLRAPEFVGFNNIQREQKKNELTHQYLRVDLVAFRILVNEFKDSTSSILKTFEKLYPNEFRKNVFIEILLKLAKL